MFLSVVEMFKIGIGPSRRLSSGVPSGAVSRRVNKSAGP